MEMHRFSSQDQHRQIDTVCVWSSQHCGFSLPHACLCCDFCSQWCGMLVVVRALTVQTSGEMMFQREGRWNSKKERKALLVCRSASSGPPTFRRLRRLLSRRVFYMATFRCSANPGARWLEQVVVAFRKAVLASSFDQCNMFSGEDFSTLLVCFGQMPSSSFLLCYFLFPVRIVLLIELAYYSDIIEIFL